MLANAPPRLLGYAGILLAVGAAVWRLRVAPRARPAADALGAPGRAALARARRSVAAAGALGGVAGVLAAAWQLAVQLGTLGGDDPAGMLGAVLLHTGWGRALAAQAAAFAAAGLASRAAWRAERGAGGEAPDAGRGADRMAAAAAVVAAAAQAGLGHAAADEAEPVLSYLTSAAHVVGAALWIGTLAALAVAWRALREPDHLGPTVGPNVATVLPPPPRRRPTVSAGGAGSLADLAVEQVLARSAAERRRVADPPPAPPPTAAPATAPEFTTVLAAQVGAFSPVALAGAALTAGAGLLNAWLRLGGVDAAAPAAARVAALTGSPYGRLLLVKAAAAAAVAVAGAVNWRRNTPRLGTAAGAAALERDVRAELAAAVAVLALSAALALSSPPGAE